MDELKSIWYAAAKARAASERAEGGLYKAMLEFSKGLTSEEFSKATKAIEDELKAKAPNDILKAAVRSTASSARATINTALKANVKPSVMYGKGGISKPKLAALTKEMKDPKSKEIAQHSSLPDVITAMLDGADEKVVRALALELYNADARLQKELQALARAL